MEQTAKRVLIIEDDDLIRELYASELRGHGLVVDSCSNGREGDAAIEKNHYDLILLDIMLPDTNGIEILKRLKASDLTKNIAVVLLTNLGQESVQKEAIGLGAKGYMIKLSYTPDQVIEEVMKYLNDSSYSNLSHIN